MDLHADRAMIGGWSVDRYVRLLQWPVGLSMLGLGFLAWQPQPTALILGLTAGLVLALAWRAFQRGAKLIECLTVGMLTGIGIGFAVGLGALIAQPQWTLVASLVAGTLWTGIAAGLISLSAGLLFRVFIRH